MSKETRTAAESDQARNYLPRKVLNLHQDSDYSVGLWPLLRGIQAIKPHSESQLELIPLPVSPAKQPSEATHLSNRHMGELDDG